MGTFTYTVRSLRVVKVQLLLFYAQLYLLLVLGRFTQLIEFSHDRHFKRVPVLWSKDYVAFGLKFTTPIRDEHILFLYKVFGDAIRFDENDNEVYVYVQRGRWDEFVAYRNRYVELSRRLETLMRSSFAIDREGDNV